VAASALRYKACLNTTCHNALSIATMSIAPPAAPCDLRYLKSKLQDMDALEERIEARVAQTRRRLQLLLQQQPTRRSTHCRLWISHQLVNSMNNMVLLIEGKLLIGHLDHQSAEKMDAKYPKPTKLTQEPEEELSSFAPTMWTHLFEKLQVDIQTVYKPIQTAPTTTTRRGSSEPSGTADLRKCILSDRQRLIWSRNMSSDAHAWSIPYQPVAAAAGWEIHAVVAKFEFVPVAAHKKIYVIAHVGFRKELFPNYPETPVPATDTTTADGNPAPPMEHQVHIPGPALTMPEIMRALFYYVRTKNMVEAMDPSIIDCRSHELWQQVLGAERISFSQVQGTLLQRGIVQLLPQSRPVKATYVIQQSNDTPVVPYQFDLTCSVPSLWPVRTRALLRRIQQREYAYISGYNKARNILPDLDDVIQQQAVSSETWRVVADQSIGEAQQVAECQACEAYLLQSRPLETPEIIELLARVRAKLEKVDTAVEPMDVSKD